MNLFLPSARPVSEQQGAAEAQAGLKGLNGVLTGAGLRAEPFEEKLLQRGFLLLSSSLRPLRPQPSGDPVSCSSAALTGGPIISDVTDLSQASMAIQMQPDETR